MSTALEALTRPVLTLMRPRKSPDVLFWEGIIRLMKPGETIELQSVRQRYQVLAIARRAKLSVITEKTKDGRVMLRRVE